MWTALITSAVDYKILAHAYMYVSVFVCVCVCVSVYHCVFLAMCAIL